MFGHREVVTCHTGQGSRIDHVDVHILFLPHLVVAAAAAAAVVVVVHTPPLLVKA